MQERGAQQHYRPEVEVIAQRTILIVYGGMGLAPSVGRQHQAVGIDHARSRIGGHLQHTLYGTLGPLYRPGGQV